VTETSKILQQSAGATRDAAEATPILAFTWNVDKKLEALELACRYLATEKTCVACFQEVPPQLRCRTARPGEREPAQAPHRPLSGAEGQQPRSRG